MVGRLRERQYQLAAEKRNEAYLRRNYYQQTARYFERESGIAKHYDSWNLKLADPKGKLEIEAKKKSKIDQLLERRSKLRKLLKEDEETYQRELDQLNKQKSKSKLDNSSLETLKKKLKEKRMEQDLYLPITCRRLRSYFLDPKATSSISPKLNHNQNNTSNSNNSNNNVISNDCTERVYLKDSTNLYNTSQEITRTTNSTNVNGMPNWNRQKDRYDNKIEFRARNQKYSARYARRSLENTNIRPGNDFSDYFMYSLQEPMMTTRTTTTTTTTKTMTATSSMMVDDGKENLKSAVDDILTSNQPEIDSNDQKESSIISQNLSDKDLTLNRTDQERAAGNLESDKQCKIDHRGFEREKNYPWMRMDPDDKNLSEKMYLFLTYKELKHQINDILKKEKHACNRQRWDDAIRLRGMKNELELVREKKIYNMKSLIIDEDIRDKALKNIEKREQELALRENACTDTSMYSDGAKVLWEKWVKEDDKFVIKDASAQREILMKLLEEEFQNLAVEDKERIAKTHRTLFHDSYLQDRHHLNASLSAETQSTSNTSDTKL